MSAFISGLSSALGGSSLGSAIGSTLGSGLIGGIKTGISNSLNKRAQNRQYAQSKILQQQQYEYNMALAQQAYDNQLDFWQTQQEYNTPVNQRKRLQDAGLNPALMYGAGQGANVAGGLSSVPNPSVGLPASGSGMSTSVQLDPLTASQVRVNEAQADKISADADLSRAKVSTEASVQELNQSTKALQDAMATNTTLKNEWQIIENDLANMTKYDRAEQISTHVQETIARTHKIYSELNLDQQKSKQIQSDIQLTIARTLLTGVEAEALRVGMQLTEAQITEAWQNVSNMITMQELYFPEAKAMQEWSKVVYPVISGLYTAIKDVFGDKPQSNGFSAGQVLKLLYGIANAD